MPSKTVAPHILACITPHGFGHAAQTTAVLNAVKGLEVHLEITLMTGVPRGMLESRLDFPFSLYPLPHDPGMCMNNALDVQSEESLQAHKAILDDWDGILKELEQQITMIQPDLVIGNIPYTVPVACDRLGIPCINLCSLNWADILEGYCSGISEAPEVINRIRQAYSHATHTLTVDGGMPMDWLQPQTHIGPIAGMGKPQRNVILDHLGLSANAKLMLMTLGGIDSPLPIDQWPVVENLYWLVEHAERFKHPQVRDFRSIPLSFLDLSCSCDGMLIKVGYGSMVEAAVNSIPTLYLPRHDWPEEAFLIEWFQQHGTGREIDRSSYQSGDFHHHLPAMLEKHARIPAIASGNQQAARFILDFLNR